MYEITAHYDESNIGQLFFLEFLNPNVCNSLNNILIYATSCKNVSSRYTVTELFRLFRTSEKYLEKSFTDVHR